MRTRGTALLIVAMIAMAGCGDQETAEGLAADACERLDEHGAEADLEPVEERRQDADVVFADYQRAVEEECPDLAPFSPAAEEQEPSPEG